MGELTQEQIAKSISAAYDSVNLINQLNSKEVLTNNDIDSKSRNIEHLKIMLGKDWFYSALSDTQIVELNNATA
jgi:hypothetical protein